MRFDHNTSGLENKKMSPEVYKLRREIIELIYEAKRLVPNLPRITVRVTDNNSSGVLGCARMGGNIIWISEGYVASRATVFHEILHAVYGQAHVVGCPLMATHINPELDKATCDKLFIKYAGKR